MEIQELLAKYESQLASTGKLRNHYLRFARGYLEYANNEFSRDTVLGYLDSLREKRGYSDGTIHFVFSVVRTLFSRNDLEWPFRRGEAPQVNESEVNAPALDPDLITEMIAAVKNGEPEERFYLALSTTYGPRRGELIEINQGDIDIAGRTIHIHTLKHGRERSHLIPEEILPIIQEHRFAKLSEFKLLGLWYRIEYRIGLKHVDGVGFHSVRRTLNTLLLDVLPDTTVMSFLRWKQRTSTNMPFRYSAQRFITREGQTVKVVGEAKDVDNKVFRVHPFIRFWADVPNDS